MDEQQQQPPANSKAVLFGRMAKVMGDLARVPKNGRNEYHKYNYADASDIKDAARAAMARHGLALFPHVREIKQEQVGNKPVAVRVWMDFVIGCSETGETLTVPWYGEAQDTGDKGFNKAMTSALKYFLIDTFLISTGDEPDPDSDSDEETQQPQARNGQRPHPQQTAPTNGNASRRMSPAQRQKLVEEYIRAHGASGEAEAVFWLDEDAAKWGWGPFDSITFGQAKGLLEQLKAEPDHAEAEATETAAS